MCFWAHRLGEEGCVASFWTASVMHVYLDPRRKPRHSTFFFLPSSNQTLSVTFKRFATKHGTRHFCKVKSFVTFTYVSCCRQQSIAIDWSVLFFVFGMSRIQISSYRHWRKNFVVFLSLSMRTLGWYSTLNWSKTASFHNLAVFGGCSRQFEFLRASFNNTFVI